MSKGSIDYVIIKDVKILANTAKAVLCEIDGSNYWIPASQIHDDCEIYQKGDEGDLIISEWIATEKEITDAVDDYYIPRRGA